VHIFSPFWPAAPVPRLVPSLSDVLATNPHKVDP